MLHLDEGTIHAYLDGQLESAERRGEVEHHLAGCPACRGRLAEERRLRERAAQILELTSPAQVSQPPFSAIARRAAKGGRRTTSWLSFEVKVAWAATVVLALAAGWYGRELLVERASHPEVALRAAPQIETRSSASQPATGERQQPSSPAPDQRVPAPAVQAAESRAALPPEERSVVSGETRKDLRALVAVAKESASALGPAAALGPAEEVAGSVIWEEVDREEAERRLGGPLATIAGSHTVLIRVAQRDGSTVTRSLQEVAPGVSVELEQSRLPLPPAAHRGPERSPVGPVSTAEVTVTWNGFWVIARAPLPADSLRKLLQRLQPAQPSKPD